MQPADVYVKAYLIKFSQIFYNMSQTSKNIYSLDAYVPEHGGWCVNPKQDWGGDSLFYVFGKD